MGFEKKNQIVTKYFKLAFLQKNDLYSLSKEVLCYS